MIKHYRWVWFKSMATMELPDTSMWRGSCLTITSSRSGTPTLGRSTTMNNSSRLSATGHMISQVILVRECFNVNVLLLRWFPGCGWPAGSGASGWVRPHGPEHQLQGTKVWKHKPWRGRHQRVLPVSPVQPGVRENEPQGDHQVQEGNKSCQEDDFGVIIHIYPDCYIWKEFIIMLQRFQHTFPIHFFLLFLRKTIFFLKCAQTVLHIIGQLASHAPGRKVTGKK